MTGRSLRDGLSQAEPEVSALRASIPSAAFSDETLASLVAQGCKVTCPVCDKRVISEIYRPFSGSGIGQHIRSAHPELEPQVMAASRRIERRAKDKARAQQREAKERPLRLHTVNGAFLDEVAGELCSLIDMMEPYYAQCDGAKDAHALLERIEAMHAQAIEARRAETQSGSVHESAVPEGNASND